MTSERPKVPSARLSAEPLVLHSTEDEPLVVPSERDLRLMEEIVTNSKHRWHLEKSELRLESYYFRQ